jgi:RNA polymerase sigma-70 factor (ECF subfamily)
MADTLSTRSSGAIPFDPADSELTNETDLVARLQAGEEEAFATCVRAYWNRMVLVARRILDNEEDARDSVQDAFLSAFKEIGRFEARSRLGTWLHRIVVNAALCRLRSRQRHPERSIEDLLPHFGDDEHQIEPPEPWKETSETALQRQEARELVRRCIGQLPDIYRTVLLLRDIEGLDTEETARVLETSAGVIKTRLHRARQALRTLLDPHFRRGDS